jgi:calcineurin-like phosphoesterase family protein
MWWKEARKPKRDKDGNIIPFTYDELRKEEKTLIDHINNSQNENMPTYNFTLSDDPESPKHYWISDTHFSDARKAIRDKRPKPLKYIYPENMPKEEKRAEEIRQHAKFADDYMVKQWNETVRPIDTVWVVGDFGAHSSEEEAREFMERLNGDIRLIEGGHDLINNKMKINRDTYNKNIFKTVDPQALINYTMPDGTQQSFVARHNHDIYNEHADNANWHGKDQGNVLVYGHTHGYHDDRPHENSLDIGSQINDFKPMTVQDIQGLLKQKNPNRKRIPYENYGGITTPQAKKMGIEKPHQSQLWNRNKEI